MFALLSVSEVLHLSDRITFAAFLAEIVVGVIVLRMLVRRARKRGIVTESGNLGPSDEKWIRWQIGSMKLFVGILAAGFIGVLLSIRSVGPIAALVGIAINQWLMWTVIWAMRRLQRRLDSGLSAASTD